MCSGCLWSLFDVCALATAHCEHVTLGVRVLRLCVSVCCMLLGSSAHTWQPDSHDIENGCGFSGWGVERGDLSTTFTDIISKLVSDANPDRRPEYCLLLGKIGIRIPVPGNRQAIQTRFSQGIADPGETDMTSQRTLRREGPCGDEMGMSKTTEV